MKKMPTNQRAVKSVPDRQGNVYNKTAGGDRSRSIAAVRYMDKNEHEKIFAVDAKGHLRETDRNMAVERVINSESRYQQHIVFTTELDPRSVHVDRVDYAQQVADTVRRVRPDADIYAISVHADPERGESHVHAHVVFGTDTTIRNRSGRDGQSSQLEQFREEAKRHEDRLIERGRDHELNQREREYIERHQVQAHNQTTQQRHADQGYDHGH